MTGLDLPGRPQRGWVGVVGLATRALPSGPVRDRFRQELVAEMYGMDREAQRQHALSVLAHAWSLRAAVTDPRGATKEQIMKKALRCRLGKHHWVSANAEDGGRYLTCARCHVDHTGRTDTGTGAPPVI
jgi:hypothetical protein